MKKLIVLLILVLVPAVASAADSVKISLPEAHRAGHVVVKPSAGYHVALEGYELPKDAEIIVFHVMGSSGSHYYYQEIKAGQAVYQMTANELKASTGSPPFRGLSDDDGAFLIIGRETQPGSINMGILYSYESISVIIRN